MRPAIWSLLVLALTVLGARFQSGGTALPAMQPGVPRFMAIDVIVDSGAAPLAAYQVEVRASAGQAKIVGIEGGEHQAFKNAPYYDPAAMQQERVIIGAFNTGTDLPADATRVARIHVMVEGGEGAGEPKFEATLQTAGGADGNRIDASVTTRIVQTEK